MLKSLSRSVSSTHDVLLDITSTYLVMALDAVSTIGSSLSLQTCTRIAPQRQMVSAEGPTSVVVYKCHCTLEQAVLRNYGRVRLPYKETGSSTEGQTDTRSGT